MKTGRLFRGALVVLCASTVSVVALFAADNIRNSDARLTANIGGSGGNCPRGMRVMHASDRRLCVDLYEASPSPKCPYQDPDSMVETVSNTQYDNCVAVSRKGSDPWRFVSLPQAQQLCAQAGKRLPSSDEWHQAALGTEHKKCATKQDAPQKTGTSACVSSTGAHDMVGNLWEWTDEHVSNLYFDNRTLPREGYVAEVDSAGIAITTDDAPGKMYDGDYFWSHATGTFGMIRGGYYGSGEDAGIYAVNASVSTGLASPGVGFRCVKEL